MGRLIDCAIATMMMLMHTVFVSSLSLLQRGGTLNECTSPRDIAVGIKLKREYPFSFVVEYLNRKEDEENFAIHNDVVELLH